MVRTTRVWTTKVWTTKVWTTRVEIRNETLVYNVQE